MYYTKPKILLVKRIYDPIGWIISLWTKCRWHHAVWIINNDFIFDFNSNGRYIEDKNKYNGFWYRTKEIKLTLTLSQVMLIQKFISSYEGNKHKRDLYHCFILYAFKSLFPNDKNTCSSMIARACAQVGLFFSYEKDPCHITPAEIEKWSR